MPRRSLNRFISLLIVVIDIVFIDSVFMLVARLSGLFEGIDAAWLIGAMTLSYTAALWLGAGERNRRSVRMERLVGTALRIALLTALLFAALTAITGIDGVWSDYLVAAGVLFVAVPTIWIVTRICLKHLRSHGRNIRRVLIVGINERTLQLIYELSHERAYGLEVVGVAGTLSTEIGLPHGLYCGDIDRLYDAIERLGADRVFCVETSDAIQNQVIEACGRADVDYYYVPQLDHNASLNYAMTRVGSIPVIALRRNPLSYRANRVVKRVTDITISSLFLIISPAIFIPVAIAIKMGSSGPVFFRQRRTGLHGKEFTCLKFRTMTVNSEADTRQADRSDCRITGVGRVLRRTSLDELPQFCNVLLGHMSIVGPRPHMLSVTSRYSSHIEGYMNRHMVKPGITGWAQIRGFRGLTTDEHMQRRVEHDLWYIEHWSMLLDLKIMARTAWRLLKGDPEAY